MRHLAITGSARASRTGITLTTRLLRERRAATLVEFALMFLPLTAILMAILEVSLTFFAQQVLETSATKAARLLMTGSAQQAGLTASTYKARVCSTLPSFMACRNVMVEVVVASAFDTADVRPPKITLDGTGKPTNAFTFDTGGPGDVLVVKTMYVWPVTLGLLGLMLNDVSAGHRLLIATAVFKTEEY